MCEKISKIFFSEYPITHATTSKTHHHHYSPSLATSLSSDKSATSSTYRLNRVESEEEFDERPGAESATSNTVLLMADTITVGLVIIFFNQKIKKN